MEMFKGLILAILVSITLNNCNSVNRIDKLNSTSTAQMKSETISSVDRDTIFLSQEDFKINFDNGTFIQIKVTNMDIFQKIKDINSPILKIDLNTKKIIAKGKPILSSDAMYGCDYFYALNLENKVFISELGHISVKKVY